MKKGCLFIVLFIVGIIAISTIYAINNADDLGATPKGKIAKSLEITPEQGEVVLSVLKTIGLDEDITINHDEGLDNAHIKGEKGYRVDAQDASNIILYMNVNGTVNMIRYGDNALYENGKTLNKLDDYIVTKKEMTDLQIRSQNALNSILKAPSTAKYPNILEWKFGKENGTTIVQSYVDSQNGFGTMIRSEFQLKIKNDKVISLLLDGKEYIQ